MKKLTDRQIAVWNKGIIVSGYYPSEYRKDVCGSWIKYSDYYNKLSPYGWEIDHIRPLSKGGKDKLNNLQPLQCDNNHNKADTFPWSPPDLIKL